MTARGDCAYVTLVTNAEFARGAAALIRSLRLTGTRHDLVVMHTHGVGAANLAPLDAQGARLVPVDRSETSAAFDPAHAV